MAAPAAEPCPGAGHRIHAFLAAPLPEELPLADATREGGRIDPGSVQLSLLSMQEIDGGAEAVVGVLFQEIVGGCSCGDEPYASPRWCRLRLRLDGEGTPQWSLLPD